MMSAILCHIYQKGRQHGLDLCEAVNQTDIDLVS